MKALISIATALVIVGALNWGLVGLFDFDLVAWLFGLDFGETNAATRVVYALVGVSGVVLAGSLGGMLRRRAPVGSTSGA